VTALAPNSPPRSRVHAIDLLRLVASVQMIAGHTIGALLAPEHRSGELYDAWTIARGLTAVAFLFAAGAAFSLVLEGTSPERARRRVRRAIGLVALGYALHPPVGAFSGSADVAAAAWRDFFAVDVLSCIGVTLLVLEALSRLPRFHASAGVLALLAIFGAPALATIEPSGMLLPIADFFSRRAGSLFPLAPFAGFVLAGAAFGPVLFRAPSPAPRVALAASAMLLVATLAWQTTTPPDDAYYAWPALSLMRLGVVLAGTAGLAFATANVVRLPTALTTLAGQSLFLYVSHLMVLYVGGVGLVSAIGETLSVTEALLAALAMIVVTVSGALVYARLRAQRAG
jgi:uncharacterized membrane protein